MCAVRGRHRERTKNVMRLRMPGARRAGCAAEHMGRTIGERKNMQNACEQEMQTGVGGGRMQVTIRASPTAVMNRINENRW